MNNLKSTSSRISVYTYCKSHFQGILKIPMVILRLRLLCYWPDWFPLLVMLPLDRWYILTTMSLVSWKDEELFRKKRRKNLVGSKIGYLSLIHWHFNHKCLPLWFVCNFYKFQVVNRVLQSIVYHIQISIHFWSKPFPVWKMYSDHFHALQRLFNKRNWDLDHAAHWGFVNIINPGWNKSYCSEKWTKHVFMRDKLRCQFQFL